jgi:hypothetical protein
VTQLSVNQSKFNSILSINDIFMLLGLLNDSSWMISKYLLKRIDLISIFELFSEERTSSTHALTMYRHKTNHKGVDYEVDIWDTAG